MLFLYVLRSECRKEEFDAYRMGNYFLDRQYVN